MLAYVHASVELGSARFEFDRLSKMKYSSGEFDYNLIVDFEMRALFLAHFIFNQHT